MQNEAESSKTNLYDLSPAELETLLGESVEPRFRLRQIAEWLHQRGVTSFDAMTNLPRDLRGSLAGRYTVETSPVERRSDPAPDGSRKYLFRLRDESLIEAVYMPQGDRTSICLSSQAGCAVGCTFCVTGFFGAGRNLSPSEIIGQALTVIEENRIATEHLNLVFMGMGEPLLNLPDVLRALEVFYARISPRRITLSTAGIIPGIRELAALEVRPNLAVSLNAPDTARREEIMPITRKYPLDELIDALADYPVERGREITLEYVLLAGWNDSPRDATMLARLIKPLRAKVNVIPFNPDPMLPAWMKRPDDRAIDAFAGALAERHVRTTVRRSKGHDIAAACGQLRGQTEKRRR
jgi:23S rRNA (adenine2503-C2)-methyltransferase